MFLDFQHRGLDVLRTDITAFTNHEIDLHRNDVWTPAELATADIGNIIIHAPPPLAGRLLKRLGKSFYDRACTIGFWHWETTRAPDTWRPVARLMDEIWAPTPFVMSAINAMDPTLAGRLKLHPNPIHIDPFPRTTPAARAAIRRKLNLGNSDFVAAFTFSTGSGFARKNPLAALDAFAEAFRGQHKGVWFILRCHDINSFSAGREALCARARMDPRIILDCDPQGLTINEFFAASDTLVSLHRAEGFGLTIAEAVQSGAKAIATGWGLAPELQAMPEVRPVNYTLTEIADPQRFFDSGADHEWASPDISHAARILFEDFLAVRSKC